MHKTSTIDHVTVLEGWIYAIMETGKKLLKPGDRFVQHGTVHCGIGTCIGSVPAGGQSTGASRT